eukprot:PLAT12258.3.p1 GENE.PLAT12258.3~~PLAT12258.3.p1  ORF type:complete len:148 (+),score=24.84 PLAT12258.3:104-547(+)
MMLATIARGMPVLVVPMSSTYAFSSRELIELLLWWADNGGTEGKVKLPIAKYVTGAGKLSYADFDAVMAGVAAMNGPRWQHHCESVLQPALDGTGRIVVAISCQLWRKRSDSRLRRLLLRHLACLHSLYWVATSDSAINAECKQLLR